MSLSNTSREFSVDHASGLCVWTSQARRLKTVLFDEKVVGVLRYAIWTMVEWVASSLQEASTDR